MFTSLRARLVVLVVLAVLPAFAMIVHAGIEQRQAAIANAHLLASQLASFAVNEQRQAILETRPFLRTLAQLPFVRRPDPGACQSLFEALLRDHPAYANVVAADINGRIFCSALPSGLGINIADRTYFQRALASRDFSVGDYQIGRVTHAASLSAAHPVLDDRGRMTGIVMVAIAVARLNKVVIGAGLPDGASLTMVDARGTVLVRHPEPERWVGRVLGEQLQLRLAGSQPRGMKEAVGLDGELQLYGFSSLLDGAAGAGELFVSVGIPRDAAVAEAEHLLRRNLGGLTLAALLAVAAAWFGGGALVVTPIQLLVRTMRRVAGGDLQARTGSSYTGGELGYLARAFDDMTGALQRREREMQRSEKMAALGRLAAGVAHELRNPLTVIDTRLQMIRRDPKSRADQLVTHIRPLTESTERMKRIVAGLSSYARPAKVDAVVLDVNDSITSLRELLVYQARHSHIDIVIELAPKAARVQVERSELTQILLNLAMNAVEAMADAGGTLTLRTRIDGDDHQVVVVEIEDTGPGIASEQLERIWEAFYTTKPEGSGLGLSIVRALAEKQGAAISVQSQMGVGTTFTLTLPLAGSAAATMPVDGSTRAVTVE